MLRLRLSMTPEDWFSRQSGHTRNRENPRNFVDYALQKPYNDLKWKPEVKIMKKAVLFFAVFVAAIP